MNNLIKVTSTPPQKGQYTEPTFILVQDEWDDYSFRTQYNLYFETGANTKSGLLFLGGVKILKKGQAADKKPYVNDDILCLPSDFISLGQSLDYYQRLSQLGYSEREKLLSGLNDIVFNSRLISNFKDEPGWKDSLFRYHPAIDDFLTTASAILTKNYTKITSSGLQFTFHPTDWEQPITFDFRVLNPTLNDKKHPLPSRIIALIGRNGSGKSTLLARLARVAHGSVKHREDGVFDGLGKIIPTYIGFPRIITVSYSAFDNFTLPGVKPKNESDPDERVQIASETNSGIGRFVFCGLRDIASELANKINSETKNTESPQPEEDKTSHTLLKSISTLADEFANTLKLVKRNGSEKILNAALHTLLKDPSFPSFSGILNVELMLYLGPTKAFMSWSTGHKIVMHILSNLAANVTQGSLILIDEPETHLHPPLLAALMHAIRLILNEKNAFAIVATHSPVVIQETLSSHVYAIRREGSTTSAFKTKSETFGENVGTLTGEFFGLNTNATDFYKVLDSIINAYTSLETIEALFSPHGLSMQARAYVMSQLATKGKQ
ncbi:AAA family ATPase [Pseudomonas sp. XS1P51]